MRSLFLSIAAASVSMIFAVGVHAQSTLPNIVPGLSIEVSPDFPGPGEAVSASIQSNGRDFTRATVSWSLDGRTIASGPNVTTASVQTGPLGSTRRLAVAVLFDDGSTASGSTVLTPSTVSLVWEANTYTPPWYRGKALASASSEIRLSTEAWFIRKNGTRVSNDQIVFTWAKNGDTLASLSGVGKNSAVVSAPQLYADDRVSVHVNSLDGSFEGDAVVRIPSSPIRLVLYPTRPTGGISYHSAISESADVIDSEATVVAEPYFANIKNRKDPAMRYTWSVNGNPSKPESDASRLTIALTGSGAVTANINLVVNQAMYLLQNASRSWTLRLDARKIPSASDPFSTSKP